MIGEEALTPGPIPAVDNSIQIFLTELQTDLEVIVHVLTKVTETPDWKKEAKRSGRFQILC
jgi:hypothetical protein